MRMLSYNAVAVGMILVAVKASQAQQRLPGAPYGRLSVIAVASPTDPDGFAMTLATAARAQVLERGNFDAAGEVLRLAAAELSQTTVRRMAVQQDATVVATFSYRGRADGTGFVDIQLDRIVAEGLSTTGRLIDYVGDPFRTLAYLAAATGGKITEWASNGRVVHVILTLKTTPSEANFVFGAAAVERTDDYGYAVWQATAPAGPTVLRVFKDPDFVEDMQTITVQREEPYFKRAISVTLVRK